MTELIGSVLGPYQITEKLGRGGMADVYKAWHRELELNRAIKVIRPEFVTSEDFRARFQKEAQGAARLRHPNIVQIHDFGMDGGHYYMVMEFLEGITLKAALVRDGRMPIPKALGIITSIAGALAVAHGRDLVHRDIKPDNIMLTTDGRAVLMDFGIAKLLTATTSLTQTGTGIGTPAYMAPEQAKGLDITPATDIYALGILLFEMLTGRVPFDADTPIAVMLKAISDPMPMPRSINPDISDTLQGVILKATAKDPLARYQDVNAFVSALDAAMARSPHRTAVLPSEPAATSPPPTPVRTGNRTRVIAGGLAAVAIIGVVAGAYMAGSDANKTANGSLPDAPVSTAEPPAPVAATQPPPRVTATPGAATTGEIAWQIDRTLAADETEQVAIPFTAGETVFLNVMEASATTDFILRSPGGRAEVFNIYRTEGPWVIRQDGEHTLTVAARDRAESNVRAELLRLAEPVLLDGSIYPGDRFTGITRLPGQTVMRHIELPADTPVYLQVFNSTTTADFKLVAPDERTEIFNSYRDAGPVRTREAGVYTLHVDPRDAALADFDAAMFIVSPNEIDLGNSPLDGMFSDRTTLPGQTLRRTFRLTAGDTVFLHVARSDVTTDFTLFAPGGNARLIESYRSQGPVQVPVDGDYTLLADPRDAALADHDVRLVRVTPPVIAGGAIVPGTPVKGGTLLPGQVVEYAADFKAGERVDFSAETTTVTFDFRLLNEGRSQTLMDTYNTADAIVIPATGRYVLQADPRDDGVGSYQFRLNRSGS